ncbi:MAG: heparinase II/III family protein [Lentisphaeria bacterium]|nr:heparinase II/III family protein [Lentisphaeria bacterium]
MVKKNCYVQELLSSDFFEKIEKGEFVRNIYPPFSDRTAWEKVRQNRYAVQIIARADAVEPGVLPQLLYSDYFRFNVDGDRHTFESQYFKRRENLAFLTLALCLTGDKKKYMPRLLDHLIAILEEWNWCMPAHVVWKKDFLASWHFCDLFGAETGALMGLLYILLGEELDKEIQGLSGMIHHEALERTVYRVLYQGITHWWHDPEETPSNWTVWCSTNNLLTAFCLEKDCKKLAEEVNCFLESVSRFIEHYEDDGYCNEGPTYFNRAGLMVFRTLDLLNKIIPGSVVKLYGSPKICAIFEFIANMRISDRYLVSFGDSQPEFHPDLPALLQAAVAIQSEDLMEACKNHEFTLGIHAAFLTQSLAVLFDAPAELPVKNTALKQSSFYKDRLAVLRSPDFSVSLKAGHNDEIHNHNDLGHFSLYHGDTPVIVDAGTGTYTRDNFTDKRYTLWHTRGKGHNAPLVGEYEQLPGKEYHASLELEQDHLIRCDLSAAYPGNAGVEHCFRQVDFSRTRIELTDEITLKQPLPVEITFLTPCMPEQKDPATILLGDVILSWEGIDFVSTTVMPDMCHKKNNADISIWNGPLKALTFRTSSSNYKFFFTLK